MSQVTKRRGTGITCICLQPEFQNLIREAGYSKNKNNVHTQWGIQM